MGQIVDFLPFLILSQVEVISLELLAHTAENLTLKFVQFVSIEEFFLCERNHYLSKYMYMYYFPYLEGLKILFNIFTCNYNT